MNTKEQIMNMKYIIVLSSLLFLFSGCENASDKTIVPKATENKKSLDIASLKENIGWIHGNCLAIKNSKIKPGENIQVILLGDPQKILDAKVTGATESSTECHALLNDRVGINKQDGRSFYNLDLNKESLNMMAVGLVSAAVKARNSGNIVDLDLNNDGIAERAGSCMTSEGVQFFISSSKTFDDKALWSDYYYLGYDNTPTCP
jgi:hypothetical protein